MLFHEEDWERRCAMVRATGIGIWSPSFPLYRVPPSALENRGEGLENQRTSQLDLPLDVGTGN